MLGIDSGWSDMAWQMTPLEKEYNWNAPKIFFKVHLILYHLKIIFKIVNF